ncbi:hypothetical protein NE865_02325 [Phthorimaea operculella]|nr:hypothetical protein NE865_02325 [Phthorimaea operculella]
MRKQKYELPSMSFPYKITRRLNLMSFPRKSFAASNDGMPTFTDSGVRKSALKGRVSDRVNEAALPYIRRLLILKKQYGKMFPPKRNERIDKIIEACNATCYTKLANCQIKLKAQQDNYGKEIKKKKAWNESEWKKHTDYIQTIAKPKRDFLPDPIQRGPHKPLEDLLPRIEILAQIPDLKAYRRQSQETWFRDPLKISEKALAYNISDRVKKLAQPKVIPAP